MPTQYTSPIKKINANNNFDPNGTPEETQVPKVETPTEPGNAAEAQVVTEVPEVPEVPEATETPQEEASEDTEEGQEGGAKPLEQGEGVVTSNDYSEKVQEVQDRLNNDKEGEGEGDEGGEVPPAKENNVDTPGKRARRKAREAVGLGKKERKPNRFQNWEKRHQTGLDWGLAYTSDIARGIGATADALSKGLGLIDRLVRSVFSKNLMSNPLAPAQGMVSTMEDIGKMTDKALAKVREDMGIKVDAYGNIAYDPTAAPGTMRAVNFKRRQANIQAGEDTFNGIAGNAMRDVLKKKGIDVDAETIMNDPKKLAELMEGMTGEDIHEIGETIDRQMRPYVDRLRERMRTDPANAEADRHMVQVYDTFNRRMLRSAQHYTREQRNIYNEGMAGLESAKKDLRNIERGMDIDMHSWYDEHASPDERALVDAMGGIDEFTAWAKKNPQKIRDGNVNFGETEWRRVARNTLDWLNTHEADAHSKDPEAKEMFDRMENIHLNAIDWLEEKKALRREYDPTLMTYAERTRRAFEDMRESLKGDEEATAILNAMDTGSTRRRRGLLSYMDNHHKLSLDVLTENDLKHILENIKTPPELAERAANELGNRRQRAKLLLRRDELGKKFKEQMALYTADPMNKKAFEEANRLREEYNRISQMLGPDYDRLGEEEPEIEPVGGEAGDDMDDEDEGPVDLDDFDNWSPGDQLYINLAGGIDAYRQMVEDDPSLIEDGSLQLPEDVWNDVYNKVEKYLEENWGRFYDMSMRMATLTPEEEQAFDEYVEYFNIYRSMNGDDKTEEEDEEEDEGEFDDDGGAYDARRYSGHDDWDHFELSASAIRKTVNGIDTERPYTFNGVNDTTSATSGGGVMSVLDNSYLPEEYTQDEVNEMENTNKKNIEGAKRDRKASQSKDRITTKSVFDEYYAPLYGMSSPETIKVADKALYQYGKFINTATPKERLDSYVKYRKKLKSAAKTTGRNYSRQIEALDNLIDREKGFSETQALEIARRVQDKKNQSLAYEDLPFSAQEQLRLNKYNDNTDPANRIIAARNAMENAEKKALKEDLTNFYEGLLSQYAINILSSEYYDKLSSDERETLRNDIRDFMLTYKDKVRDMQKGAYLTKGLKEDFVKFKEERDKARNVQSRLDELTALADAFENNDEATLDQINDLYAQIGHPFPKDKVTKEPTGKIENKADIDRQMELLIRVGGIRRKQWKKLIDIETARFIKTQAAPKGKYEGRRLGNMTEDEVAKSIKEYFNARGLPDDIRLGFEKRISEEREKDIEAIKNEKKRGSGRTRTNNPKTSNSGKSGVKGSNKAVLVETDKDGKQTVVPKDQIAERTAEQRSSARRFLEEFQNEKSAQPKPRPKSKAKNGKKKTDTPADTNGGPVETEAVPVNTQEVPKEEPKKERISSGDEMDIPID